MVSRQAPPTAKATINAPPITSIQLRDKMLWQLLKPVSFPPTAYTSGHAPPTAEATDSTPQLLNIQDLLHQN